MVKIQAKWFIAVIVKLAIFVSCLHVSEYCIYQKHFHIFSMNVYVMIRTSVEWPPSSRAVEYVPSGTQVDISYAAKDYYNAYYAYRQTARGNKTMFADDFPYYSPFPPFSLIKYTSAILEQKQTLDFI